jgi:hypothetical protein
VFDRSKIVRALDRTAIGTDSFLYIYNKYAFFLKKSRYFLTYHRTCQEDEVEVAVRHVSSYQFVSSDGV